MHEASLIEGLLKLVFRAADDYETANPARKPVRIKEVICDVGLLSAVEPETLTACFEMFTEGTKADGARLVINILPLQCQCENCGKDFLLHKRHFFCPDCGSEAIRFASGNAIMLQAINVDCGDSANDRTYSRSS